MPNPLYPQSQTVPPGQTANNPPFFPSFLPSGNQMATGLTPQHLQQINQMGTPTPQVAQGAGMGGPASGYQQIMDFFKQMGGGNGNFGGSGSPFVPTAQSIIQQGNSAGRENIQNAARNMFLGIPMPANIPAPQAGSNGLIAPGDVAAYNSARTQAADQRTQLAQQIMGQQRRARMSPGNRGGGGGGRGSHD